MTISSNPFARGSGRLNITRILLIDSKRSDSLLRRPIHAAQCRLTDSEFESKFCKYDDHCTFVPEHGEIPEGNLPYPGLVAGIVYSVCELDGESTTHIGDTPDREAAEALVGRLSFQTGHYNRSREISSDHIPDWARRWMRNYVRAGIQPPEVFFQAYEIPNLHEPHSLGFRLLNTPWTDERLARLDTDSQALRQAQQAIEIPGPLIDILHLAAIADIRILILDPEAPVLAGLWV